MSLLFDYYRAVFSYVGQFLSAGHWLAFIGGVLGLLLIIFLFFVMLGFISEKLFSPFGSAEGGKLGLLSLPVIMVLGILAAIVIPQFVQYRERAEVAAGTIAIQNAQQGVDAYVIETLQLPSSLDQIGVTPPASGEYSLTLGDGGQLTVTFNEPAELAGKSIQFSYTPQAATPWTCMTDLDPALLPENLRELCAPAGQTPTDQQTPPPEQQPTPEQQTPAPDQTPAPSADTSSPAPDQQAQPADHPPPADTDHPPPA